MAITKNWLGLGRAGLIVLVGLAAATPAISYAGASDTREMSAQTARPRVTITPRTRSLGPNAKRYCRSWLEKEYRVSGTVIVPKMQCWWQ